MLESHLVDSFPANGKLRETVHQSDRIRHARHTVEAYKAGFFINARTDVFFQCPAEHHDGAMVIAAIERAHPYARVGADGLFAPGLVDITLIARLAKESPLPLNIMVGDTTPSLRILAEHGVARVCHGPWPYLIAMKALEEAARGAAWGADGNHESYREPSIPRWNPVVPATLLRAANTILLLAFLRHVVGTRALLVLPGK